MSALITPAPGLPCSRGHANAAGSKFCCQCGEPLHGGTAAGVARAAPEVRRRVSARWFRSRSITGLGWEFFASVRVATVIIFVLAAASVAGTLIEQEGQYSSWMRPEDYYPIRYGPKWGLQLFNLGLTRVYSSWWFLGLLSLLAISLIVCSIDRFVPLWRLVHKPPVMVSPGFLRRQRHFAELSLSHSASEHLTGNLLAAGYRVQREGYHLFADKGRWSRWGPYITHIGILMILLAGIARVIPGWYHDTTVSVQDGQTVRVPNTDFAVRSDGFESQFYPDGRPKMYATEAVIVHEGQEVRRQRIEVNRPLTYRQVSLFQSSYQTVLGTADIELIRRTDGNAVGRFQVDLAHPDPEYRVGDLVVEVADYFPDFALDPGNKPVSRSGTPNNPGFRFRVTGPNTENPPLQWFFLQYPDLEGHGAVAPFQFRLVGMMPRSTSVLRVHKDLGVPMVYAGSLVAMLGLALTFYLSHRRIWAMESEGRLLIGGDALRHQAFFRREFGVIVSRIQDPEGSDA